MVLYFTGTGNSRYVAERIAGALGDELLSMNDRIKAGDTSPVTSDERLVIVTPTYAWRMKNLPFCRKTGSDGKHHNRPAALPPYFQTENLAGVVPIR